MRGSSHVPPLSGTMPRFVNAAASFDDSAAMRMSQSERDVHAVAGGTAVQGAHGRGVDVVEHDRWGVAQVELTGARPDVAETTTRRLRGDVETGAERPARCR